VQDALFFICAATSIETGNSFPHKSQLEIFLLPKRYFLKIGCSALELLFWSISVIYILFSCSLRFAIDISSERLRQLLKKYNVTTSGSKEKMAQGLFRLSSSTIETPDLELIYNLLDKDQQKKATQLIQDRINKPITNYRGMYEPLTKPISSMTREELIKNLQKFRDSWEKITTRDTDLSDERLNDEPTEQLRNLIKFYYSTSAKLSAEDWLRNYV
jgi:hypothetical protein